MIKKTKKKLYTAITFLALFGLWTVAVSFMDVKAIGPKGSCVGLGTINGFFHQLTGVHMTLYTVTDWLGLVPVTVIVSFGLLGLIQWIRRRKLCKVDRSILLLGGFYIVVLGAYILFEKVVINRRPILIDGFLEASYPSSTTMLAMCVMLTAQLQLRRRIQNKAFGCIVAISLIGFTVFLVLGRLLSGVHWLSDIIGGVLLSAGLILLYDAIAGREK